LVVALQVRGSRGGFAFYHARSELEWALVIGFWCRDEALQSRDSVISLLLADTEHRLCTVRRIIVVRLPIHQGTRIRQDLADRI